MTSEPFILQAMVILPLLGAVGVVAASQFGVGLKFIRQLVLMNVLITFVLFRFAPQSLWMLPGLWQIVFSLGFLASCRLLPRPMFAVGVWYLATGPACLAFANGVHAFSPWAMAIPFGVGQLAMAGVLHWSVGKSRSGEYRAEF